MRTFLVIVVFLSAIAQASAQETKDNVMSRSNFANARLRFERDKVGHVAFLGGSITEMNGYRPIVCEFLTKRFPETKFTFTNAGISSTCSTTGAFRLATDVLEKGPVDLLFVEYAVNDDQDAHHARRECIRGMEGIVRRTRAHNPKADIVVTYFVNPGMLKLIEAGKLPVSIAAHEDVAKYYGVSSVHLASEVADRIKAGTLTWERYGGVHPARPGNELCASLIERMLSSAWKGNGAAKAEAHPMPSGPLDAHSYGRGRFVDIKQAKLGAGWIIETPDWKKLAGQARDRFRTIPMLCATEAGKQLTLDFTGDAVGAYLVAGPDAGMVEASIDDGPFTKLDLYHGFSRGLHYPRTVMFATDLKAGPHVLKVRIADDKNKESTGHSARIMHFVVNGAVVRAGYDN